MKVMLTGLLGLFVLVACSNRKNTATSRAYHSINTRYNIHFNAQVAYNDALQQKHDSYEEIFAKTLPVYIDSGDTTQTNGGFTTSIDKTTKAIKLHSIKARPKRDREKMRTDSNYVAWVNQKEFNPFLNNTWMLLGKSEFHSANYLRAISTFMYISSVYASQKEIVTECKLWIARSYTAMGWLYEAENTLRGLERDFGILKRYEGMHAMVRANYHVKNGDLDEAILFLEKAIKKGDRKQRTRLRYLLGQLYEEKGDKQKAYEAYKSVKGLSTPHLYSFNADLNQISLEDINTEQKIKKYTNLSKKFNNKEYLDQIFNQAANVYLNVNDTVNAIEYFYKSIDKSTRNGYDKALSQVQLGDVYFEKHEFINAQPHYKGALPQLNNKDKFYDQVHLRSEVLDDLVIHAKVVNVQDSLLHLASLPEHERIELIEQKIKDIKKEEEEKKKREEQEQRQEEAETQTASGWGSIIETTSKPVDNWATDNQNKDDFYFYNPSIVEKGRVSFQGKWGRRKLEDDWRRKEKSSSLFGESMPTDWSDEESEEKSEEIAESEEKPLENDIYSVDYYLQQLPLTPEAVETSNKLIAGGLFNMGMIYREKLGDLKLADIAFRDILARYPDTKDLEEIYYQLLLVNMQAGNKPDMEYYRNRLLAEFPEGKYTTPLRDPNYEWNYRNMSVMQEKLYGEAYEAYSKGQVQNIRNNFEEVKTKFPFGYLMPKFELLNALSYAQSKDIKKLESNLTNLVKAHPNTDESALALSILERIKDGHILLADGSLIHSIDWGGAYTVPTDSIKEDITFFSAALDVEHQLLLSFPTGSVDRNELLYQVADYNFSNYLIHLFDLDYERKDGRDVLSIKGFKNFNEIRSYVNDGFVNSNSLFNQLSSMITVVPISAENYPVAYDKLGMNMYISFFSQAFYQDTPALIAMWEGRNYTQPESELVAETKPKEEEDAEEHTAPPVSQDEELKVDDSQKISDIDIEAIVAQLDAKEDKDAGDIKDISLEDLLSEEQLKKIGQLTQGVQDGYDNPVEGIKSIFQVLKKKDKLTQEEQEYLKELENQEKTIKARQKAYSDSIAFAEKALQDSLKQIELDRIEVEQAKIQAREAEQKALEQAKETERKAREELRLQTLKEREARRKQQERDREQLRKDREQERNRVTKEREEARKLQLQERERARKEQLQEMERRRKEMEERRRNSR